MTTLSVTQRATAVFHVHAIKATAVTGLLGQVGRVLVSLLTLPLLLSYLGQDGLGVWMIALSLMGLVGFVSSGLSASVVTAIGRASAAPSRESLVRLSTAASLIALCYGAIVFAAVVPTALLIDWTWLLGLGGGLSGQPVARLMSALAVLLACGLVVSVPRQIMLGRMHGYLAHMLDFAGLVAGAVCLVIAIHFQMPLWLLGAALMAPPMITVFIGGLIYLHHADIPLFSRRNLDRETFSKLGRDSLRMAGYQSAFAVSSQSDLFLIGIILGAPASAAYGIAQRVFSLPILVSTSVNQAQWPAMARADAAGEHAAVGRMFRRTLAIGSGVAISVAVAAALAYEPLIRLWLGRIIESDPLVLAGMVAWVIVATPVITCDGLLRARQETSFLMRCMFAMATINIPTTLLLLPWIGPAGAIWGSVTGYMFALLLPYSFRLRGSISGGEKRKEALGADAP